MGRHPIKSDFPVNEVRHYLESGPIVLVSSRLRGHKGHQPPIAISSRNSDARASTFDRAVIQKIKAT
jgi:hypothetical protein